eukprot:GHVH01008749.1.p1 GENE.GHVH01008749.1~~GHVH01008749.1.p1  ORF type:complete len:234 (+),score=21.07 GHVH01008749.1:2-703(+)
MMKHGSTWISPFTGKNTNKIGMYHSPDRVNRSKKFTRTKNYIPASEFAALREVVLPVEQLVQGQQTSAPPIQLPPETFQIFPPIISELIHGNNGLFIRSDLAVQYVVEFPQDLVELNVGTNLGSVGAQLAGVPGNFSFKTGWRKVGVMALARESELGMGVGVFDSGYGYYGEGSLVHRFFSQEIIARFTELAFLTAIDDRDYGMRIKVRDFGWSLRADIDDIPISLGSDCSSG